MNYRVAHVEFEIFTDERIQAHYVNIESIPPPLLCSEASLPRFDPRIMHLEC
jgi:hypothetical protein